MTEGVLSSVGKQCFDSPLKPMQKWCDAAYCYRKSYFQLFRNAPQNRAALWWFIKKACPFCIPYSGTPWTFMLTFCPLSTAFRYILTLSSRFLHQPGDAISKWSSTIRPFPSLTEARRGRSESKRREGSRGRRQGRMGKWHLKMPDDWGRFLLWQVNLY